MRLPRWPVWLLLLLAVAAQLMPLPAYLQPFRPPWATLAIIYWALMWPGRVGIATAWIAGLLLDITQGTLLGQHALSLCVVTYLVLKFHLQLRVFPLWQLTLAVFALVFLEAFLLLWIDGVSGAPALGPGRWGPVIAAAFVWPIVMGFLDRIRERLERRDTGLA